MRFMRWSYADLLVCPEDYLQAISKEARRLAQEARQRGARRGGRVQ